MSLRQFVREYRTVRHAEGWGSSQAAYYQALPFRDLSGRFPDVWRIRARSYTTFLTQVLEPLERSRSALKVLDIGAGNGWLSARLAHRGHWTTAVDILDDPFDGLGATRHYPEPVHSVMAEFDHLPFPEEAAFDLAIFNASLHYSTDYTRTLSETLRTVGSRGTLVILDSPMYSNPSSGLRMVRERETRFLAKYGFASNALTSEHFLTPARLEEVGEALGIDWQPFTPRLDLRTSVTRTVNGLRARREPARFPVIVGTRT